MRIIFAPAGPRGPVVLSLIALVAAVLAGGCEAGDGISEGTLASGDTSIGIDDFEVSVPDGSLEGGESVDIDEPDPVVPCKPGEGCDDGDPCTADDACVDGECVGVAYSCEADGLECTLDRCDGFGGCTYPLDGGWCFIDGECIEDDEAHPDDPCLACVAPVATDAWSADDGRGCDDGDACTSPDLCASGECIGGPAAVCNDDNPCTTDTCNPQTGCEYAETLAPCSDGNPCTIGDACVAGECTAGSDSLSCDDANPCTDDTCVDGDGCVFSPNDETCSDGDPCTLGDGCVRGVCAPGAEALICVDGNLCTDDLCDPVVGCSFVANSLPCDDGNACTLGDVCSSGACQIGLTPPNCDDNNPCTDDSCDSALGCINAANVLPCDDGSVCTLGDTCGLGDCIAGADSLECIDGNACTDDLCDPVEGCVYAPNGLPCDDGDLCTTGDTCEAGACVGEAVNCFDGNICTVTSCNPGTGACDSDPVDNIFACVPQIQVTSPARAAMLDGPKSVLIQGNVVAGSSPVVELLINGDSIGVGGTGNFSHVVEATHGMNILQVVAINDVGNVTEYSQSFYWSPQYLPATASNPNASLLPEGLRVWLGEETIDDGNHNPNNVDDIATVFEILVNSFDIGAVLGSDLGTVSGIKIKLKSLTYGSPTVTLDPISGGLNTEINIPNLNAKLDFTYELCVIFCTDITVGGSAKANNTKIDTNLFLSVNASNGQVNASVSDPTVTVSGLDVSLDGAVGFLTNWIVNFFEDDFADDLENAFESEIAVLLPPLISDALESLALDTSFDVPPLLDGASAVTLDLFTGLSSSVFQSNGGTLGLAATAVAAKGIDLPTKGALRRASCGGPSELPPVFSPAFPLQIALHDDLVNQLLYAIWWGGGLAFPVDDSLLGGVSLPPGITDIELDVEFLLPPIATACNPSNSLNVQIGDVKVKTSMMLGPLPVELDIYASFSALASFVVTSGASGPELGISISEITEIVTHLDFEDEGLLNVDDALKGLIETELVPDLIGSLAGGALAGFPIPEIDLSFAAGIPAGTSLALDITDVARSVGYTFLQGSAK